MGGPFLIPPGPAVPVPGRRPHPGGVQTWQVQTWWRQATCAEANCEQWRNGWSTVVDTSTPLGRDQADYIRTQSGRRYREAKTPAGWTQFDFPAGQRCFASDKHRVQAERQPLHIVRAGSTVQPVGRPRVYERPDQWADDFHARTETVATARRRAGTAD